WSSGTPAVATIDPSSGLATAAGDGSTTITATSGGVSGTATLHVARTVASLTVSPATATLHALGATQQFTVIARDANDSVIPDPAVAWTSGAPGVATVDGTSGLATAVGNGTATITATSGGTSSTATLTVSQTVATIAVVPSTATLTALGATQAFTASALDANGHAVAGITFTWTSADPGIATVGVTSGVATAVANGTTTITATGGGVSGSASLTVAQRVASVTVSPASAALHALGDTAAFTASVVDANGHPVTDTVVTWSSSAPNVASVDPTTGVATAVGNGTAQIVATAGGTSGSAALTVLQTITSITVTPDTVTLTALDAVEHFTATARDANDSLVSIATFLWSSGTPSVATIDPSTGIATAVGDGKTTITAAVGGVSGSATLTVHQVVTSIAVSPSSATIAALGGTQQFTAVALDGGGQPVPGVTFAWTSADPGIATVGSTSGVATAVANGLTTITATGGGASGSATLTVAQRVASVTVSPATAASHALGDTTTFVASGVDANGHPVPDAVFTWSSSAPAVASVDPATGTATAVGNGTAQVVATADGASGSGTLTVAQTITSVSVSPTTDTLYALGATQQFVGTARDANDSVVPNATFSWTSSAPAVATVNPASGIATADADGTTTITGTAGGHAAIATLVVRQRAASIVVTPSASTLTALGATQQFTASARDANGNVVPGVTFTWASGTPSVATIAAATGLATADTDGTTIITASGAGLSGAATLTVQQAVASVTLSPASATLDAIGATQTFGATARDANGNVVPNATFVWSSSAPAVATIDPSTGVATATGNGTTTITATASGVSGTATLDVQQVIASIVVTPDSASLTIQTTTTSGSSISAAAVLPPTQQFTATALDANGKAIAGITFTWASSDTSVAVVDQTGLATAAGPGVADITATSGGVTGTAVLTVQ
ncbi:MAG TPA: Ig-like domain-containing protein, partial [Gemmatimonadales bacterium]|nr:Ig-like domain-containing protein [Gemmatimonadales bacterium]